MQDNKSRFEMQARSLCRRVLDHGTLTGDAQCLAVIVLELLDERRREAEASRDLGARVDVSDDHRGSAPARDIACRAGALRGRIVHQQGQGKGDSQ